MIRCNKGEVRIDGTREDLCAEFMTIVEVFAEKKVFSSNKDLMEAVEFSLKSEKEKRKAIASMLTDIFLKDSETFEKLIKRSLEGGDE